MVNQERFLRRGAAKYLTEVRGVKTAPGTLQKKATTGGGPLYQIVCGQAIYTKEHLDAYADEKLSAPFVSSTAELPPRKRKALAPDQQAPAE